MLELNGQREVEGGGRRETGWISEVEEVDKETINTEHAHATYNYTSFTP